MNAFNFSRINKREKRLYSISDLTVSKTGIPTKFLGIAGVLVGLSLMINIPICAYTGDWYFIPFKADGTIDIWGAMIAIGIPIGIASALYYIKVSNYRLIEVLLILLRPKHPINISGKKTEFTNIKIDAFLERQ